MIEPSVSVPEDVLAVTNRSKPAIFPRIEVGLTCPPVKLLVPAATL